MYFWPNFLLLAKRNRKTAKKGPKIKFVIFGFFEKSRRNLKILENPETFTKKNIFCTRFVLSKLFCSSKQKKVIAKTKMSKFWLWRPVAGPQWPGWPNEVIWAGFGSKRTYWWSFVKIGVGGSTGLSDSYVPALLRNISYSSNNHGYSSLIRIVFPYW